MKNDMLKSGVLVGFAAVATAAVVLSGCDSQAKANPLKTNAMSVTTTSCTVTAISGGATVACSDGTSVSVMNGSSGSAGAQGIQGLVGPTGPAGSFGVSDRSGFSIGTSLVSYAPGVGVGAHGIVVANNSFDHGQASYNLADGTMVTNTLYYQALGCSGTPFVAFVPGNTVFANSGSRYKVAVTGALSFAPASYNSGSGCITGGPAAQYMFPSAAYAPSSNDLLPISVNIPLSIQ